MRNILRIGALALGAIGLTAVVWGCGKGGDTPAPDGGGDAGPKVELSSLWPAPNTASPNIGATKQEGPLKVHRRAFTAKVKGFDPCKGGDLYSGTAIVQICEPLFEFDYLARPMELKPLTAEALPETSPDGLTLTIKLKKGILFHDDPCFTKTEGKGRELVAQDYIYSWKRIADPKNQSPLWAFFQGAIAGIDDWREMAEDNEEADYTAPVSGLQTPDPHTLVITLAKPNPQFKMILAMAFTVAVPYEAVQHYKHDFMNHAVGTGAYRLTEWVRDNRFTLERNPNYHAMHYPTTGEAKNSRYIGDEAKGLLKHAGMRAPYCDRVEVSIIVEAQPRWLEFVSGKADVSSIPKDAFGQAIAQGAVSPELLAKGITLEQTPDLDLVYISFNMSDDVLGGEKGKLVRQAISCAVNVEDVRKIFYNDRGMFAQSPIPPGLFGYDPDYKNPNHYDLDRAKKLMAEAGFPDGKGLPEITYSTTNSTTSRQMAEHLQADLGAIGIKVKVDANTWPKFNDKVNKGQAQFWGIAWGADYPDPENFLFILYGPNAAPAGQNGARFQNPEFDELYEKMRLLPDGDERYTMLRRMVEIVAEHQPWIFEVHREAWVLSHPWCDNYKYPLVTGGYYKYVHVDMAKRKEKIGE